MYGLSDQKSTPVCCGELRTDLGSSDTNLVPRRRSSRTARADGRKGGLADGKSGSCLACPVRLSTRLTVRLLTHTSPTRTARTPGSPTGGRARRRSRGRPKAGKWGAVPGKGDVSTRLLASVFVRVRSQYATGPKGRQGRSAAGSVTRRWRYSAAPWRAIRSTPAHRGARGRDRGSCRYA